MSSHLADTDPRWPLYQALVRYRERCTEAADQAQADLLVAFVAATPCCAERSWTEGHLTGSAWITDAQGKRFLLTHHRKLGLWLQLGGHADGDLDLRAVAQREGEEESGLTSLHLVSPEIFDVDRHWIPPRKSEPGHWHYDVRYAFTADPSQPLLVSEESHALAWVEQERLDSLTSEESMHRMARKTKTLPLDRA